MGQNYKLTVYSFGPTQRDLTIAALHLHVAPVEGRQSLCDWHHLQTYLKLFTKFANSTLMQSLKVRERRGLYGTIHLLSISNSTAASKQSLQPQKTASGSLKMTSETAETRPIIFNIKSYPCMPKTGSHFIQGMAGHSKARKQIPLCFIGIDLRP